MSLAARTLLGVVVLRYDDAAWVEEEKEWDREPSLRLSRSSGGQAMLLLSWSDEKVDDDEEDKKEKAEFLLECRFGLVVADVGAMSVIVVDEEESKDIARPSKQYGTLVGG
ncbi:hypothetical protein QBC37DRAFT_367087 [Rhypophila decipiens]|uniref:Uncharacterized protein n=1 Tax=Rhypophila decipiens TaxID=261697 RepID=A0AAN7BDR8_9PEZI|nr:hypothetical protein QBC37DRAFT_367087 [Rhypophila decipiens]